MTPDSSDPKNRKNDGNKQEGKKPDEIINMRSSTRSGNKNASSYDAILDYIKTNTKDSIAYVLMILGILLLMFDSVSAYGGLIIGVVFALYFANELAFATTHAKEFIEEFGLVKSLVLAGTLLALFIKAPFLLIGAAIVLAIKVLVWPGDKGKAL